MGAEIGPNRSVWRPFFGDFRQVFLAQSPIGANLGPAEIT